VSSGGDNGNFAAIDEIAQIMADVAYELRSNKRSAIIYKSKPCERKAGLILNNDKLKALGWKVNNSLRDGICQTMKAYLN
jgi:nucleoside-diphosphate-sugar epimerase